MKEEERQAARLPETISFSPIGIIHSEHTVAQQTPAQPVFARDCQGILEIFPPCAAGLKDIEGFSHLYLIYHLHQAGTPKLVVKPFLQDVEHGIFATRTPLRPNAIGLSIVELTGINENRLFIRGVDILDGPPFSTSSRIPHDSIISLRPVTAGLTRSMNKPPSSADVASTNRQNNKYRFHTTLSGLIYPIQPQ